MGAFVVQPTNNQSPDATLGGLAVTTPTNTGHASTTASCSGAAGSQTKSCRWFALPNVAGQRLAVTLKITHTTSGALTGAGAFNSYQVDYSTNGGGIWNTAVLRQSFTTSQGPTEFSVALSLTQDISQVQIRDFFSVTTQGAGESASATATISGIKVEVVTNDGVVSGGM